MKCGRADEVIVRLVMRLDLMVYGVSVARMFRTRRLERILRLVGIGELVGSISATYPCSLS